MCLIAKFQYHGDIVAQMRWTAILQSFGGLAFYVSIFPPDESKVIFVFWVEIELIKHWLDNTYDCDRVFLETTQDDD